MNTDQSGGRVHIRKLVEIILSAHTGLGIVHVPTRQVEEYNNNLWDTSLIVLKKFLPE